MTHATATEHRYGRTLIKAAVTGIVLVALLGLAGCSKGPGEASAEVELSQAIREAIAKKRAPKPQPLQISRALLDQLGQPHIEVTVESHDLTGYLGLVLTRQDDFPGEITVWRSSDNNSLAFRNGMLIASRGLGGNLLSARVPAQNGIVGPASDGARSYQLRHGDNVARQVDMACELRDLGAEQLKIIGRSYATRHIQEYCEGAPQDGRPTVVVNDYWVDSRRDKVWKSRQWAGPEIGYLRIRDLSS
ncbi:hypothetical protein PH5382_03765 [Phaeobacter sp. CECT 5382]|uniref:YjbF family lipoprotein n=1 Tax=Phaeobacter sp. CECT 5382 TaxID=1712645 RepID=UPI0006DA1242|nr:YjbF family lipoprotein [Phaeobacter sp. CECT 5382]CUH89812.1 hypothetical protein PH5382_03765 [Phaeobacter sp. CECT 5382]